MIKKYLANQQGIKRPRTAAAAVAVAVAQQQQQQQAAPEFPVHVQQPTAAPIATIQVHQAPPTLLFPVQAQQLVVGSAPAHFQAQPLIGPAATPRLLPSTLAASKEYQEPSAPTNSQHPGASLDVQPGNDMVTTPLKFVNL